MNVGGVPLLGRKSPAALAVKLVPAVYGPEVIVPALIVKSP